MDAPRHRHRFSAPGDTHHRAGGASCRRGLFANGCPRRGKDEENESPLVQLVGVNGGVGPDRRDLDRRI